MISVNKLTGKCEDTASLPPIQHGAQTFNEALAWVLVPPCSWLKNSKVGKRHLSEEDSSSSASRKLRRRKRAKQELDIIRADNQAAAVQEKPWLMLVGPYLYGSTIRRSQGADLVLGYIYFDQKMPAGRGYG